jgi:hypothetical protein
MFRNKRRHLWMPMALCALLYRIDTAEAQLTDLTQTPNVENAGIVKSLQQQIGAGVGNINTPGSSIFITQRDPARAVRRGRQLFQRKFTDGQGFGPRAGDGSGNIHANPAIGAGLIDSCAGCHGRPRGSAGFGGDVVTKPDSRDAPHLFGLGLQEMLGDEITGEIRGQRTNALNTARSQNRNVTVSLSSKGVNYGSITARPNGTVDTSQLRGVDADLRVKPFFAQGSTTSIREFVVGAFNDEMGLQAVDLLTIAGANRQRVTTPAGMVLNGPEDVVKRGVPNSAQEDPDGDGVVNEIPQSLVDFMEFYLLNYFKPGQYQHTNTGQIGQNLLNQIGCTACHIPNMVITRDRRVADVETSYNPAQGVFNDLYAVGTVLFSENDDGSGHPTIKIPNRQSFFIRNFYADLKRHDIGPAFYERNYDGTLQREFMTEPLWGVGSSPPYGHDGRSVNLREVILRHGGEAQASRNSFASLSETQQDQIMKFLSELVLFPPDDTTSNLGPANPSAVGFPQRGHGSIALAPLFNNPNEGE